MRLSATLLAGALALAACQPAAEPADADAAEAASDAADAAADTAGVPAVQDSGTAVAADGDGLRLVDAQSGATRLLAFGASRDQAVAALDAAMGGAGQSETVPECYSGEFAGPVEYVSYDGLSLVLHGGAFVGWTGRDPTLSTLNGIAPGSSRADVEAAGGTPEESSLGLEGEIGGVGFILNEAGTEVGLLYAGSTCFAR